MTGRMVHSICVLLVGNKKRLGSASLSKHGVIKFQFITPSSFTMSSMYRRPETLRKVFEGVSQKVGPGDAEAPQERLQPPARV